MEFKGIVINEPRRDVLALDLGGAQITLSAAQLSVDDVDRHAPRTENCADFRRRGIMYLAAGNIARAKEYFNNFQTPNPESYFDRIDTLELPKTLGVPLGLTKHTDTIGGGGGGGYEGVPENFFLLRGLKVQTANFAGHNVIGGVIPLFLTTTGFVEGKNCGGGGGPWHKIAARPGYAVGALFGRGGDRLDGFKLVFMRITPTGLDPKDKYDSSWIGGSTQIGGTGAFIIGVFGRCGSEMDAMGLVLKP